MNPESTAVDSSESTGDRATRWTEALRGAMDESAEMLGFGDVSWAKEPGTLSASPCGAHITLAGERTSAHLGFYSTREGNLGLARTMLCMEPDESLESADLADAIGEVANIVVGSMKTRLADIDASLVLGLPMFVEGHIVPGGNTQLLSVDCELSGVVLQIRLLMTDAPG